MAKFDGYLICTDCDGTLTNSMRAISEENQKAISYFQENGGLFTVASGRYPHYIEEFKDSFVPNTYVIGVNGAVLYDLKNNEPIESVAINGDVFPLLKYVFECIGTIKDVMISGPTDEIIHYVRGDCDIDSLYSEFYRDIASVNSADEIKELLMKIEQPIYRILFVQEAVHTKVNAADLREHFASDCNVIISWDMGIEIIAKGTGKGEMIQRMRSLMPHIHTTIGVGDYDNDISMLDMCDISYAVSNAPDEVKSHAKRVTVSCDESAIARIIEDIS